MNRTNRLINRAYEAARCFQNRSGKKVPNLRVENNGDESDVYLYDEIDSFWGVDVNDFINEINEITSRRINVRINSPGGNVFDGIAIMTALAQHKAEIHTYIDGVAASMASGIAMSGSKVHMSEGAFLMIHNPSAIVLGNADDMRYMAGVLDKVGGSLALNYSKKTQANDGIDHQGVLDAMAAETWYTADEAKSDGFVNEIIDIVPVENWIGAKNVYENTPKELSAQFKTANDWRIKTERELEQFLRDAGCSNWGAKKFVSELNSDHRDDGIGDVLNSLKQLTGSIER